MFLIIYKEKHSKIDTRCKRAPEGVLRVAIRAVTMKTVIRWIWLITPYTALPIKRKTTCLKGMMRPTGEFAKEANKIFD